MLKLNGVAADCHHNHPVLADRSVSDKIIMLVTRLDQYGHFSICSHYKMFLVNEFGINGSEQNAMQ